MAEPKRKRAGKRSETFTKPVFPAREIPVDEPFFTPAESSPAQEEFDEPIFDAVPAQARGVTLPVDAPRVDMGWEALRSDTAGASDPASSSDNADMPLSVRRLGRTGPVWVGLSAVALILVVLVWLFLRNSDPDETLLVTSPAAGVVGSVQMADADAVTPSPEPSPTPVEVLPAARFAPGAEVVVGNTNGQGIRLRAAPGTDSLTLGIYNDGAPFLVLTPGGDYGDYPVEANGYFWYRIRVLQDPADQLVGWVVGDFLARNDQ